jgi:2,5-diamino-6-(ribosylamino)-4(3H)-pyrimidinone 5'-phosphate reductase
MGLHYQIAGKYKPDAHLIGSNTIKTGVDLYGSSPPEEKDDFNKPKREDTLPYWVIIDTKGILQGLLHEVRRFDYCKDVIIFVSKKTPKEYLSYLKERKYDFYILGINHVNLEKALNLLYKNYNVKTILTDCGKILGNFLLNKGLIKEISLLVHPVIVGKKAYNIFSNINKDISLKLIKNEILNDNYFWLVYRVDSFKDETNM